ncbi:hypothetical protein LJC19_07240 [Oxalobacter sp. OttesenSCG-928-P03]|nr:hypothetical protein [Oxalobacter sp. OttesenSCG-928-P03]
MSVNICLDISMERPQRLQPGQYFVKMQVSMDKDTWLSGDAFRQLKQYSENHFKNMLLPTKFAAPAEAPQQLINAFLENGNAVLSDPGNSSWVLFRANCNCATTWEIRLSLLGKN